jgi:hypothetical protein
MTVAAQMIFESHPTTIIVKRPLKMIDIRWILDYLINSSS